MQVFSVYGEGAWILSNWSPLPPTWGREKFVFAASSGGRVDQRGSFGGCSLSGLFLR